MKRLFFFSIMFGLLCFLSFSELFAETENLSTPTNSTEQADHEREFNEIFSILREFGSGRFRPAPPLIGAAIGAIPSASFLIYLSQLTDVSNMFRVPVALAGVAAAIAGGAAFLHSNITDYLRLRTNEALYHLLILVKSNPQLFGEEKFIEKLELVFQYQARSFRYLGKMGGPTQDEIYHYLWLVDEILNLVTQESIHRDKRQKLFNIISSYYPKAAIQFENYAKKDGHMIDLLHDVEFLLKRLTRIYEWRLSGQSRDFLVSEEGRAFNPPDIERLKEELRRNKKSAASGDYSCGRVMAKIGF